MSIRLLELLQSVFYKVAEEFDPVSYSASLAIGVL